MPTRRISQCVLPQGWGFFISTLSCRCRSIHFLLSIHAFLAHIVAYANITPQTRQNRMRSYAGKQTIPTRGPAPPTAYTIDTLKAAADSGEILEAITQRCGADHTLHFSLDGIAARMPREEAVAPWISGATREIAVLSRVGRPTCFVVSSLQSDAKGAPLALLSRRAAQETAMEFFLEHLEPGMVLTCRVVRLESFGAFLDIGCGVVAMLPIEHISVSRIHHSNQRFQEGQKILAAVYRIDPENRRSL